MHISEGKYHPQPHTASQLNEFPVEKLTFKQVQQFLGIVNYMVDFIPDLTISLSILSAQLKKDVPPWSQKCTKAVKELKRISKTLPSLKIPATSKRILQTDVLLEEDEKGKQHICGYKSGVFKEGEKHYHSTYKEILAVKKGIEKFEFHLVGQHFLIEMYMSSFPKMIQFKQKVMPQEQLLRWGSWFSQWKFDVKHIKWKENVLPDFLSRTQRQISVIIPMIYALSPENPAEKSLRQMISMMPQGLQARMLDLVLVYRGLETVHGFLKLYIHRYGLDQGPLLRLPYHPVYPFLTTIKANPAYYEKFPKEAYLLFWYLADLYTIGVLFDKCKLLQYLAKCILTRRKPHYKLLYKWLTVFHDVTWWQKRFTHKKESLFLSRFECSTIKTCKMME